MFESRVTKKVLKFLSNQVFDLQRKLMENQVNGRDGPTKWALLCKAAAGDFICNGFFGNLNVFSNMDSHRHGTVRSYS